MDVIEYKLASDNPILVSHVSYLLPDAFILYYNFL